MGVAVMHHHAHVGFGVLLAVALVAATNAQEPSTSPTFRSTADAVRVDAAVQRDGRPVTDLAAADFEILDNGVPQSIGDFSYERLPIDVSVALDVSKSVTGDTLERLQRAVDQLRTRLRPGDRLKLVTFNMRVRRLFSFEDRTPDTRTAFASVAASGSTSLIDTLMVLLTAPASPLRRQLIIAFSDVEDTSSVTEPDVALDIARRSTPTIALVKPSRRRGVLAVTTGNAAGGFSNASAGEAPGAGGTSPRPVSRVVDAPMAAVFAQLALETGGRILQPEPDDSLAGTFSQVLDEFRASYALSFAPRGVATAGVHTLEVKVQRRGNFQIRARRTYVAD